MAVYIDHEMDRPPTYQLNDNNPILTDTCINIKDKTDCCISMYAAGLLFQIYPIYLYYNKSILEHKTYIKMPTAYQSTKTFIVQPIYIFSHVIYAPACQLESLTTNIGKVLSSLQLPDTFSVYTIWQSH